MEGSGGRPLTRRTVWLAKSVSACNLFAVPERQLNLFTVRSVLAQRFDAGFFRGIPRRPGVYLMSDASNRIIYVGKARDLRARLTSYRYVHSGCSRKTARLVARVTHIRWEVCPSEEAALLEENRLLRELRPRFNRVNTWPRAYRFIRIRETPEMFELSLSTEHEGECYGAFKTSRECFAALLRLLASADAPYERLPRRLLCHPWPMAWSFAPTVLWLDALRQFLRGECSRLLQRLREGALNHEESAFDAAFRNADLTTAEQFFIRGPQWHEMMRRRRGHNGIIPQEELDDWIVQGTFAQGQQTTMSTQSPAQQESQ